MQSMYSVMASLKMSVCVFVCVQGVCHTSLCVEQRVVKGILKMQD